LEGISRRIYSPLPRTTLGAGTHSTAPLAHPSHQPARTRDDRGQRAIHEQPLPRSRNPWVSEWVGGSGIDLSPDDRQALTDQLADPFDLDDNITHVAPEVGTLLLGG
jgi:hypothetical protein